MAIVMGAVFGKSTAINSPLREALGPAQSSVVLRVARKGQQSEPWQVAAARPFTLMESASDVPARAIETTKELVRA